MVTVLVPVLAALATTAAAATAAAATPDGPDTVCRFSDQRLDEISAMAWSRRHPDVLWLLNDSGGGPYLYAVDATTCRTVARVRISGATARDYESIATGVDSRGRDTIWVGDTGDNRSSWPDVRVIAVAEPATLVDGASVRGTVYRFGYPDRPHDAETLLADPGSPALWVVTKELLEGALWSLPPLQAGRKVTAGRLADVGGLVTDGSVSGDRSRTVIRDYVWAYVFAGPPSAAALRAAPVRVSLPRQVQGEAVAWAADGQALLVASERDDRLLRVPLPPTAWTATARSAAGLDPTAPLDPSAPAVGPAAPPTPSPARSEPAADPAGDSGGGGGGGGGAARTALGVGLLVAAAAVFAATVRRLRR